MIWTNFATTGHEGGHNISFLQENINILHKDFHRKHEPTAGIFHEIHDSLSYVSLVLADEAGKFLFRVGESMNTRTEAVSFLPMLFMFMQTYLFLIISILKV